VWNNIIDNPMKVRMVFMKSSEYDTAFVKENMMGPNSMKIVEEMAESLKLEKGMRVLDLGCGRGLTSIFLAKEYGVTVLPTCGSVQQITMRESN
jgi:cyclopropane fatty-acyl-phospholipid synthase-like methyltransferase